MRNDVQQNLSGDILGDYFENDLNAPEAGGCRKLSFKMLEEMGKVGVSKMEFNTLLYLARCQDSSGRAYCNVHMLMSEIGISDSYFPGILHILKDKGLIDFKRTSKWRENRNGIYEVTLLHNFFDADYSDAKYIRLGHGIFQTGEFLNMTVAEKYIILMAMYEIRHLPSKEIEKKINGYIELNYWLLYNKCLNWSGLSRRTITEAFRKIKKTYKCKVKRSFGQNGSPVFKGLLIKFSKSDLQMTDSDNYLHYNNITCAAFEEEGIHLTEILKKQGCTGHAADLVIRHAGKTRELVDEAKKKYQKGMLIRKGQPASKHGHVNQVATAKIKKYSAPFQKIVGRTMFPAKKFGAMDETGTVCRWDTHSTGNAILKNTGIPLWLRYLLSEAISGFRWMSNVAGHINISRDRIDVKGTVSEFMNMLLRNKAESFGYAVRRICMIETATA